MLDPKFGVRVYCVYVIYNPNLGSEIAVFAREKKVKEQ